MESCLERIHAREGIVHLTIPGFGPDLSAKVLGTKGDPDRFQNGKQVLKLAGLNLGVMGLYPPLPSPKDESLAKLLF